MCLVYEKETIFYGIKNATYKKSKASEASRQRTPRIKISWVRSSKMFPMAVCTFVTCSNQDSCDIQGGMET